MKSIRLCYLLIGGVAFAVSHVAIAQIPIVTRAQALTDESRPKTIDQNSDIPIVTAEAITTASKSKSDLPRSEPRPISPYAPQVGIHAPSLPPIVQTPISPRLKPNTNLPEGNRADMTGATQLSPLMADSNEHPDVSLPTEIPIIRASSSMAADATGVPIVSPQLEAALLPVVRPNNGDTSNYAAQGLPSEVANANWSTPAVDEMSFNIHKMQPAGYMQQESSPVPATPIISSARPPNSEFPRSYTLPTSGPNRFGPSEFGSIYQQDPIPDQDAEVQIVPVAPGAMPAPATVDDSGMFEQQQTIDGLGDSQVCPYCGGAGCEHCMQSYDQFNQGSNVGDGSLVDGGCYGADCDAGCFGFMPCARRYFIADVLYWTREDGQIAGTNFGGIADYDYDFGLRVTAGERVDSVSGHEFRYFGLRPLEESVVQTSGAGSINALFIPAGGLGGAQIGSFFNAVETTQSVETQLHSIDMSRVRWGWDTVQTSIGIRYIRFEDNYQLDSRNIFGSSGTLAMNAENQMVGPDLGVSLFYDVGRRISFSGFGRIGGYLNLSQFDLDLINNGVQYIDNNNNDTNFSASLEGGFNAHLHLARGVRLRGGYNLLWLWQVTTTSNNFPAVFTPSSGLDPDDSDTAFFHGFSAGFEIYR